MSIIMKIFNKITESCEFPEGWKIEHQIVIQKEPCPNSEDQLRNISKTAFLSKTYESFIVDWLMPYVKPHLDPNQHGGLKGSSVTHYLVKLLHFIHMSLDNQSQKAVILTLLDLSKAYNRGSHRAVIEDLFDMKTPGWLLAILISYLSNRRMRLKFQEVWSDLQPFLQVILKDVIWL